MMNQILMHRNLLKQMKTNKLVRRPEMAASFNGGKHE